MILLSMSYGRTHSARGRSVSILLTVMALLTLTVWRRVRACSVLCVPAAALAIAAAGLSPRAEAQSLAEIDSEALFVSQTGATIIELPVGGVVGTPSFGGVTVTAHTGSTLADNVTPVIEPVDFGLSGVESFNVALDSPAFGFGFEFAEAAGSASTFTFTLFSGGAGGTQVGTFTFQRPADVLSFVGGVTDSAFDYVEIREIVGTNDNDGFGTFAVTTTTGEFWTSGASGNWDTAGNWTGGTAPISTDNVFITPNSTLTVTGPAAATTVNALTIDNQDLTNGGGAGATTVNLSTGALTVTNGLVVGATATDSGTSLLDVGTGTLNVGGDTNIRTGGTLSVANGGTYAPTGDVNLEGGTLSVDAIGSLTPNWTSGTLQVTGASGLAIDFTGQFDNVGIDVARTLDVSSTLTVDPAATLLVNGGTVLAGDLDVGVTSTLTVDSGTATINGTLTNTGGTVILNGGNLTVNDFNNSLGTNLNLNGGTLTIDGGAFTPQLATPSLTLDGASGGPTLELINDATASFTGDINVASTNDGGLSVLSGSDLSTTTDLLIGQTLNDSDSTTTFSGPGSTVDVGGNLLVGTGATNGNNARNLMVVADDAALTVDGDTTLGANGRVELTGGSITTSSWTRLGFSQFAHTGGTLNVDTGNFNSGTSNYVLGGADRPVVNLTNGATYTGGGNTNVDITNGEMHVLSGSTMNLNVGTASLQVFNTGTGGAALLEIDGAGSSVSVNGIVDIGTTVGGDGTLMITNGGSINSTNSFAIAENDNTIGIVTVDGTGSILMVTGGGGLFVGNEGQGTLDVTNGGLVTANTLTIADSDTNGINTPTSTMTVNGDDGVTPSTLNVTGVSHIGGSTNEDGGVGILNIQAGALYNSNGGIIGSGDNTGPDGTGTVNVTGTDSFWNAIANGTSDIWVGDTGAGTLNVSAGGRVDADAVFIGRTAGSENAEMTIDGGTSVVNVQGSFVVGEARKGSLSMTGGATLNTSTTAANGTFLIGNSTSADDSSVLVDNASIVHNGTGRVAVGDDSNGTASSLTIQNGGTFTAADNIMLVADQANSTGNLVIDGDSTLTVGRLLMGDNGAGTATISNGADLIVNTPNTQIGNLEISAFGGGTGTMTVTDPGSTVTVGDWLSVGDEGTANGTLDIQNGAVVSTSGHIYIARVSSSSTGVITVQDLDESDGSTLTSGASFFLGGNAGGGGGDATLNVNVGGTVNVTNQLKLWEDGKVILNGGTINTGSLDLADPVSAPFPDFTFTSGTFRFTAAGTTTLGIETLDDLLGPGVPTLVSGQHLAVVADAALSAPLRLNGGSLSVGSVFNNDTSNLDFDTGTFNLTTDNLTVGAGGLFGSAMVVDLGQTVNITNLATVDAGAELTVIGDLSSGGLTNNGDFIVIDTTGSGKTINGAVANPAGSAITVVGDITFADNVSGAGGIFGPGNAIMGGGFAPGDSTAAVNVEGDLTFLDTSTFTVEIGGTTPGAEFDQVLVGGVATLDGTLDVDLINGFSPSAGDSFGFLSATGGFGGMFDTLDLPALPAELDWQLNPGGSTVFLEVISTLLLGDANKDGQVTGADLISVQQNFGNVGAVPLQGDANNDGQVTGADLISVQQNFGNVLAPASPSIPEPASLAVLCFGALFALKRRE